VGVESDEELLCLRVAVDPDELRVTNQESLIRDKLSAQLPEGCELLSASVARAGRSFQPSSATYVLAVKAEYLDDKLKTTITDLLASENLNIRRRTGAENSKIKNLDVRVFLKSIKLDGRSIIVECNISPAGSIRVDEILRLLELDEGKLESPVRRTNVQWQVNES
jgi:hypothetical protein